MAESLYTIETVNGEKKVVLHPHSGQLRVWDADARFVFMLAGSQGGKTSFGPWWLHREIQRRGRGDYLAVTSTYDLFNLKMLPEMVQVFGRVLGLGKYWPGIGVIELADPRTRKFWANTGADEMWGRIILRSASSEGGLESATAKAAWLDEAGQDSFTLDAWYAVLRRLSLSRGRVLATTTPYNEGWIKQQVYDRWLKGDPDYAVVQFASTENPLFSEEEFERAKGSMPLWKFMMFYKGEFAKPPGLIYSDYDEAVHMVAPFSIPSHWPRVVGIDPGAVHFATVWLAENPATHVYYAYRESLDGNRTISEIAVDILQKGENENVVQYVGGAGSEKQWRLDLTANGVRVAEPPFGGVEAGLDRVISLLKQKRLYVFESMTGLRDEFARYKRKLNKAGEVTEEISEKNTFHYADSLRYGASVLTEIVTFENIGETGQAHGNALAAGSINEWGGAGAMRL